MKNVAFQNTVKQLTDDQAPRAWSLLVTIFGELAQDDGAEVSGSLLRHLCALIGIKPEAMRVALHRLRKDGWIDSRRIGRTSVYFLTGWGGTQSAAASPRIYSAQSTVDQAQLVIFDTARAQSHKDSGGVWMSPTILLTADRAATVDTFTTTLNADASIPHWMKTRLCDDAVLAKAQDFADKLEQIHQHLSELPNLGELQECALRVLLVHSWRRIILKTPELPDFVFPNAWCGAVCRQRMADLLEQLPKRGLAELEAAIMAAP